MNDKCSICQASFASWNDYNKHHTTKHGGSHRVIYPIRTTNRTKAQIVADFEARHQEAII